MLQQTPSTQIPFVHCPFDVHAAPFDLRAAVEKVVESVRSSFEKKGLALTVEVAEGTAGLVLDVKFGSGAFMKEVDRSRELARTMVGLGDAHGVRTVALLTDMDTPLGRTAGNGLEIR